MDLAGKWKYNEEYLHGKAEGELILEQDGERLSGRIIFTDQVEDEETYMIQEFLEGEIDDRKVKLNAVEYDIIHANQHIFYELDSWFGICVDDRTIVGVSVDGQGIEGRFTFEKM